MSYERDTTLPIGTLVKVIYNKTLWSSWADHEKQTSIGVVEKNDTAIILSYATQWPAHVGYYLFTSRKSLGWCLGSGLEKIEP